LEVGAFEGRSAVWMLENVLADSTARMTVVDVFDGPFKDRYLANIDRSGAAGKVNMITGYSQLVLRDMPLDSFDIIFIDGSHQEDGVLEDAVLSWRLLKEGGILIFDDYRWFGSSEQEITGVPKKAIDPFVECFDDHVDVIHNSYQVVLKKRTSVAAE
jgi:predicted O-methyltransferase YrrM